MVQDAPHGVRVLERRSDPLVARLGRPISTQVTDVPSSPALTTRLTLRPPASFALPQTEASKNPAASRSEHTLRHSRALNLPNKFTAQRQKRGEALERGSVDADG